MHLENFRYKIKVLLISVLICTLSKGSVCAFAQKADNISKADKLFENFNYAQAIPYYKKYAATNDVALRKLADCYRLIKNYADAEICYGRLASKNSTDSKVYYYYGEALLYNNKYEIAKKQFGIYSILSPNDTKGELYAKACDAIKDLLIKPAQYKVFNLGEINSEVSDFCPAFFKNGIVFTSERVKNLVTYNTNKWTNLPFLSLVFTKGSHKKDSVVYEKWKVFSKNFSSEAHYGPACFNADYTELFLTKVDNNSTTKSGAINQAKIYTAKYSNKWSELTPLPFNSDTYTTGHPSLSKDGQYLYFASNREGGLEIRIYGYLNAMATLGENQKI